MEYSFHVGVFVFLISMCKCVADFTIVFQNESSEIECNTGEKIRIDVTETNSSLLNRLMCDDDETHNCSLDYSSTQSNCDDQHSCTITGSDLTPIMCLNGYGNLSIRYPCGNGNVHMWSTDSRLHRHCYRLFMRSWDSNDLRRRLYSMHRCLLYHFDNQHSSIRLCDTDVTFDSSCIYLPFSVNVSYSCVPQLDLKETDVAKIQESGRCTDPTIIGLMVGAVGVIGVLLGFVIGVCFSKRIQIKLCADKSQPQEEHYQGLQSQQSTQQYDGLAAISNNYQVFSEEMYNEVESPAIPQSNTKMRTAHKELKTEASIYGNL